MAGAIGCRALEVLGVYGFRVFDGNYWAVGFGAITSWVFVVQACRRTRDSVSFILNPRELRDFA